MAESDYMRPCRSKKSCLADVPDEVPEQDEEVKEEEEEDEEEEEELIDPHVALRESCSQKKECAKLKLRLDTCNERVEGQEKTTETCMEELIDFMHCVDHCAAETLFSKLK